MDIAVRIAHGDHLPAQLGRLFSGVDRDVAGAGDDDPAACKAEAACGKHLLSEVAESVTSGLGADQRTAEGESLAGKHSRKLVSDALILTEHIADFPASDPDISGRNIGVRADVTGKLGHKRLAEPHDFSVAFALWVKVRAALGSADRQTGQGILEHLLKSEEFQNRSVDRGMQPKPAFVRTDG